MKFVRRFLPFILVFVFIVSSAVSVGAVGIGINADHIYVRNPEQFPFVINPVGDSTYQVDMDVSNTAYWERYLSGDVRYTNSGSSWDDESSQQRLLDNIHYVIYPFGEDIWVNFIMSVSNIVVNLNLDISSISKPDVTFDMKAYLFYRPRSASGGVAAEVGVASSTLSYQPGKNSYSFNLIDNTFGPSASGKEMLEHPVQYYIWFEFTNVSDQSITTQMTYDLSFDGKVSYLVDSAEAEYLMNYQTQNGIGDANDKLDNIGDSIQDTNDKLDDTNDKLDETNDNLDQIINGDVNAVDPPGSSGVNDAISQEDQLLNDAIGNWEANSNVFDVAMSAYRSLRAPLRVVSQICTQIINIQQISWIFYISLSLGVVSVLLNIGIDIVRHDASVKRKHNKGKKGKSG